MLTLDLQILGQRHKDVKNGLSTPPRMTIPNIVNLATKPRCLNMLRTQRRTFRNIVGHAQGVGISARSRPGPPSSSTRASTVDDVKRIRDRWGGKLILKGSSIRRMRSWRRRAAPRP